MSPVEQLCAYLVHWNLLAVPMVTSDYQILPDLVRGHLDNPRDGAER